MSLWTDPQPDSCESCGWETEHLVKTDAFARIRGHGPFTPNEEKVWGWLCQVCRSTFAGNAWLFPRQYENQPLFALVAWGINFLDLDEASRRALLDVAPEDRNRYGPPTTKLSDGL